MTAEQKLAIDRLSKWAVAKPGGMRRMTTIWRQPMQMAVDVNIVLAMLPKE